MIQNQSSPHLSVPLQTFSTNNFFFFISSSVSPLFSLLFVFKIVIFLIPGKGFSKYSLYQSPFLVFSSLLFFSRFLLCFLLSLVFSFNFIAIFHSFRIFYSPPCIVYLHFYAPLFLHLPHFPVNLLTISNNPLPLHGVCFASFKNLHSKSHKLDREMA